MSINIHIQKKDLWLLSAIMVFLVGVGYVIAYNSGASPSVMGHSAEELEGVCRSDGTDCPAGFGGGGWVVDGTSYPDLNIPEVTWYDLDLSPRVGNRNTLVLLKVGHIGPPQGQGFNRGIIAKPYNDPDDFETPWGGVGLNQQHLSTHGYYKFIMTPTDNNGHIGLRSTAYGAVEWDVILVGYIGGGS